MTQRIAVHLTQRHGHADEDARDLEGHRTEEHRARGGRARRLVAHQGCRRGAQTREHGEIAQENTLARPVISQAFSEELVVARAECSGRMPQWARATPSSSTPSE